MVAKPQIDGSARGRAGVPLARAQRLAEKADAKSHQGKSPLPLLSAALGVVVLGVAGYFYGGSNQTSVAQDDVATAPPTPVVATAEVSNPAPAADQPITVAIAETTMDLDAAQIQTVAANVEPVTQLAPRPVLAPCVQSVEQQLLSLHNANDLGAAWDVKRQRIRDTVQSVLDCDLASFDLTGDFELAASDLADLQVNWDRSAANLKLTIVDSIAPTAEQVVFTSDGQPIAFIVN